MQTFLLRLVPSWVRQVLRNIESGDAYPIRQRPRHLPVAQQEIEAREVQSMLDRDITERALIHAVVGWYLLRRKMAQSGFA